MDVKIFLNPGSLSNIFDSNTIFFTPGSLLQLPGYFITVELKLKLLLRIKSFFPTLIGAVRCKFFKLKTPSYSYKLKQWVVYLHGQFPGTRSTGGVGWVAGRQSTGWR